MAKLTRRRFFLTGLGTIAATGTLGIGWLATPVRQRLVADTPPDGPTGSHRLNGWVTIGADDSVIISMSKMEMGQGIHTGLAMLLVEELDADMSRVKVLPAFEDPIFNNQALMANAAIGLDPRQEGRLLAPGAAHILRKIAREVPGLAFTGASTGIVDQWGPMREAGASARSMLLQAAAKQWAVPVRECSTARGRVLHTSGRSASFGELAQEASKLPLPASVHLKSPGEFKIIGKPLPQLNAVAKSTGAQIYGIDVIPEGLLYAAVKMCPVVGGTWKQINDEGVRASSGVRAIVPFGPQAGGLAGLGNSAGGVAVVAESPHEAMRAAEAVEVIWELGSAATASSREIVEELRRAVGAPEQTVLFERGDVDGKMNSGPVIRAEYDVPFLAHAAMEPMNCTVRFENGTAEVWVGSQAPGAVRNAAAEALGIDPEKVKVHAQVMGGGFGRKTFTDCVAQAAIAARQVPGRPVQLLWSREQDMAHDFYRPPYVGRCAAVLDTQGRISAWDYRIAGSSMGQPALLSVTREGAVNTPYELPAMRVQQAMLESAVPTGIWRSVAHSFNAFFVESFIDELAAASRSDPVAFRLALLSEKPRHQRVLSSAAKLSGWGETLPLTGDGQPQALGIALHESFGSVVAQVVRISVDKNRAIRVHDVTCVVDCGVAVNPNLVRQQMEGGIVYGLSATLRGNIEIEGGAVKQSNFHDYAPLRMHECPSITTHILPSMEPPTGIGEAGTPPIAPAVANAVFALTGTRVRSLPLQLV